MSVVQLAEFGVLLDSLAVRAQEVVSIGNIVAIPETFSLGISRILCKNH